jgi:hypothetical protein
MLSLPLRDKLRDLTDVCMHNVQLECAVRLELAETRRCGCTGGGFAAPFSATFHPLCT